jgi:hypothetical protein
MIPPRVTLNAFLRRRAPGHRTGEGEKALYAVTSEAALGETIAAMLSMTAAAKFGRDKYSPWLALLRQSF